MVTHPWEPGLRTAAWLVAVCLSLGAGTAHAQKTGVAIQRGGDMNYSDTPRCTDRVDSLGSVGGDVAVNKMTLPHLASLVYLGEDPDFRVTEAWIEVADGIAYENTVGCPEPSCRTGKKRYPLSTVGDGTMARHPSISQDHERVAFVEGDSNGGLQVFTTDVHDLSAMPFPTPVQATGISGTPGDPRAATPRISNLSPSGNPGGFRIAYRMEQDFAGNDNNGYADVYYIDINAAGHPSGTAQYVGLLPGEVSCGCQTEVIDISNNGDRILFQAGSETYVRVGITVGGPAPSTSRIQNHNPAKAAAVARMSRGTGPAEVYAWSAQFLYYRNLDPMDFDPAPVPIVIQPTVGDPIHLIGDTPHVSGDGRFILFNYNHYLLDPLPGDLGTTPNNQGVALWDRLYPDNTDPAAFTLVNDVFIQMNGRGGYMSDDACYVAYTSGGTLGSPIPQPCECDFSLGGTPESVQASGYCTDPMVNIVNPTTAFECPSWRKGSQKTSTCGRTRKSYVLQTCNGDIADPLANCPLPLMGVCPGLP